MQTLSRFALALSAALLLATGHAAAQDELIWLGEDRFAHLRRTDLGLTVRFLAGQPEQSDPVHLHSNETLDDAVWDRVSRTLLVQSYVREGPGRITGYTATGQRLYVHQLPEEHHLLMVPGGGAYVLTWSGLVCRPDVHDAATGHVVGTLPIPDKAVVAQPVSADAGLIGVCNDELGTLSLFPDGNARPAWSRDFALCPWTRTYISADAQASVDGGLFSLIIPRTYEADGAILLVSLETGEISSRPTRSGGIGGRLLPGGDLLVVTDDPELGYVAILPRKAESKPIHGDLIGIPSLDRIFVKRFVETTPGMIMVNGHFPAPTGQDTTTRLLIDLRDRDSSPFPVYALSGAVTLDGQGRLWRIKPRRSDGFEWWRLHEIDLPRR